MGSVGYASGYGIGRNKNAANNKYFGIDNNYSNKEKERLEKKKEDYQAIAKKFYSIILHLQEELGKLTVNNYKLEQENNFLREQLKNID